jgi:hypothetical protein
MKFVVLMLIACASVATAWNMRAVPKWATKVAGASLAGLQIASGATPALADGIPTVGTRYVQFACILSVYLAQFPVAYE